MINTGKGVCASIHYAVISYGVRLRVARSTWMGTCQSLELRSGHLVWLSRFFRINQSNAKEGVRRQQCRIVSDSSGISIHYDYWDQFVKEWMGGKYARALHVPEPWWGWCPEDGALHSVTVNQSPEGSHVISPLKNIVIVRSSLKNITKIAGEHIFTENISIELAGKSTTIETFRLSEELYPHVSDVLFVCLSGSRNNLPTQKNLTQIINIINHQSKQQ